MFDFSACDFSPRKGVSAEEVRRLFSGCDDFTSRAVRSGAGRLTAQVFWLDGCVSSRDVSEDVIRPLRALRCRSAAEYLAAAEQGGVWSCAAAVRTAETEIAADLGAGFAAVFFPGAEAALTFEVKSQEARSVDTPSVEKSVLGAKDAFVETLRVNTSLVRRRLPTPALKLWQTEAGERTKTRVDLLYIEGTAPAKQVEAVKRRLGRIDARGVTSAGELVRQLSPRPRGAFPRLVHTERPDRFVQGLLRGKLGVLCDGLPVGLLLPCSLPELLQVQEDRARHAAVAAALYLLRAAALFLSLLLPALYVAIAMYHQELIPYKLLLSVIQSKAEVPFSTAAEVLGMLLSFALLQEAGIRLPEPVGQTVSVIGALIVGQSAVEAKVLSPIVIIVVAMAGIGSYALPSQELGAAVRLWRAALVALAAALGLFGLMAGVMALLWRLCDMEDMGLAYLFPLCDTPQGEAAKRLLSSLGEKETLP